MSCMSWIILLNCVKGCSGYKGRGYYSGVCAFFCLILKHAGQRNRSYTRPDMRHSTPITVMDRYLCTVPILDTGTRVWSLHHWLGHLSPTIYGWPVGLLYIYTIVLGGLRWVWAKCYETYWRVLGWEGHGVENTTLQVLILCENLNRHTC